MIRREAWLALIINLMVLMYIHVDLHTLLRFVFNVICISNILSENLRFYLLRTWE